MAKVFSRQKRHPFAAAPPPASDPPIPLSVTMEEWNGLQDTQEELPPPKEQSPTRSKATTTTNSSFEDPEEPQDFGLSCSGLLGEEVMLDTGFGEWARSTLEATGESLRVLSQKVVFHKPKQPDEPIIMVDNSELLKENERLRRENTWLQEENESLRGGTYHEEEEDVMSSSV